MRRWSIVLTATAVLVAPLISASPGSAEASTSIGSLVPPRGAWFGSWIKPEGGWSRASIEASIGGFERDLGTNLGIDHHFFPWGSNVPGWQAAWDVANGRLPLVTWGETDVAAVNVGRHDAYIAERARAVRAVGAPMFLRWFGEMETAGKAAKARSPQEFIRAWRRIHGIFAAQGATNVAWVWCPTAYGFVTGDAAKFYPGDGYVDWLCADGYNWAPGNPTAAWRGLGPIFREFHAWGLAKGKPMMIGETGVQERHPGEKAAWFADAVTALKQSLPGIKAFVYFSAVAPDFSGRMYDFRFGSTPSSYSSFVRMGRHPYLRPLEAAGAYAPRLQRKGHSPSASRLSVRVGRNGVRRIPVVARNDGSVEDALQLRAKRRGGVKVRIRIGGRNVGGRLLRKGMTLPSVGPGAGVGLRVIVRVPRRARDGSAHRLILSVTSSGDPSARHRLTTVVRS